MGTLDTIFWWVGCIACVGGGIVSVLWAFLYALMVYLRWARWLPGLYEFMRERRRGLPG